MSFSDHLASLRERRRQPSLSAAVAVDDRIVWADAVGNADPLGPARAPRAATQYRVASLTKPQVAVALLVLADAGALDVHRPISVWMPDTPAGHATVAQFLAHSSGLRAEPAGPWWERAGGCSWDDLLTRDLEPLFPAGSRYHYSNVGYAVLGRLLETLTDTTWDAALADLVWTPLGMTGTAVRPASGHAIGVAVHPHDPTLVHPEPVPDYLAMAPAGALWSTPSDLVRFGSLLAGRHPGILRQVTLDALRTPLAWADVASAPWTSGHGLGIQVGNVGGVRTLGHSGSVPGFTCDLRVDPVRGVAVAVCGNATHPFGGASGLLDRARAHVAGRGTDAGPDPEAASLAGIWYWGATPHRADALPDGRLRLTPETDRESHLFARDADGWVGVGGDYFHGERLRVVRDAGGGVRSLDIGTFCFTREPYDPAADLPGGADAVGWRPST